MKNIIIKNLFSVTIATALFCSCGQTSRDREIKKDIASKAKTDINFAAVNYTVEDGIVRLAGVCHTPAARDQVLKAIKSIRVIDSVESSITVAPITINERYPLKISIDSVLATYPAVRGEVTDSSIVLSGKVHQKELEPLLGAIQKLRGGIVINEMETFRDKR